MSASAPFIPVYPASRNGPGEGHRRKVCLHRSGILSAPSVRPFRRWWRSFEHSCSRWAFRASKLLKGVKALSGSCLEFIGTAHETPRFVALPGRPRQLESEMAHRYVGGREMEGLPPAEASKPPGPGVIRAGQSRAVLGYATASGRFGYDIVRYPRCKPCLWNPPSQTLD